MAQQTLSRPYAPHMGPNPGDSSELGDSWDGVLAKLNAMFAEQYAGNSAVPSAAYNTNAATAAATLTAANISGGVASVDLALTGTLTGAANAQLPLATDLMAALANPTVGDSYRLRIINESAGAFAWTVTTNTGWTLAGTMTIAQNTWREFVLTLGANNTATLQSVATGTYS